MNKLLKLELSINTIISAFYNVSTSGVLPTSYTSLLVSLVLVSPLDTCLTTPWICYKHITQYNITRRSSFVGTALASFDTDPIISKNYYGDFRFDCQFVFNLYGFVKLYIKKLKRHPKYIKRHTLKWHPHCIPDFRI